MSKKISTGLITYWIFALVFCLSVVGYMLYREAVIFPPTRPANVKELATWSELDLRRLMEHYNCGDIPWKVPDDLKELKDFCNIVSGHWSKKYDERKIEDAREGAKKFKQE